jgi:hypothetical protein
MTTSLDFLRESWTTGTLYFFQILLVPVILATIRTLLPAFACERFQCSCTELEICVLNVPSIPFTFFMTIFFCAYFCRIREIDADIKQKNQRIETVEEEVKDTKDRMAVMVEHLKNVQQVRPTSQKNRAHLTEKLNNSNTLLLKNGDFHAGCTPACSNYIEGLTQSSAVAMKHWLSITFPHEVS